MSGWTYRALSRDDKHRLINAVSLHQDYIRGTGIFEEYERPERFESLAAARKPIVKALSVEQMAEVVELERLKKVLWDLPSG